MKLFLIIVECGLLSQSGHIIMMTTMALYRKIKDFSRWLVYLKHNNVTLANNITSIILLQTYSFAT